MATSQMLWPISIFNGEQIIMPECVEGVIEKVLAFGIVDWFWFLFHLETILNIIETGQLTQSTEILSQESYAFE